MRFLLAYNDPTPEVFPPVLVIDEMDRDVAIKTFAEEHGLVIDSIGGSDVWFSKGKVGIRYLINDKGDDATHACEDSI